MARLARVLAHLARVKRDSIIFIYISKQRNGRRNPGGRCCHFRPSAAARALLALK